MKISNRPQEQCHHHLADLEYLPYFFVILLGIGTTPHSSRSRLNPRWNSERAQDLYLGDNNKTVQVMPRGKVKWFSVEKGYGFIEPSDGSKDVFVHRNNVSGLGWDEGLRDGEEVEYEVERTPKGLSATNVERVSSDML